ncbi:MAG: hypothetical protein HY286_08270 [Planctomycetes bacterium]|nr:hypothetical protein [Planctomycetota bacterium]
MTISRGLAVFGAAIVGILIFLAAVAILNRRDQSEPIGGEIRIDDFGFTAQRARWKQEASDYCKINAPESAGNGESVVVTLKVTNYAKRVDFTFRPETVFLIDREHRRATRLAALPLDGKSFHNIPAGSDALVDLVFRVSSGDQSLLIFSFGQNGFLDVLDDVFFGKKQIRLN